MRQRLQLTSEKYVEECQRLAQRVPPEDKKILLGMAEAWKIAVRRLRKKARNVSIYGYQRVADIRPMYCLRRYTSAVTRPEAVANVDCAVNLRMPSNRPNLSSVFAESRFKVHHCRHGVIEEQW